VWASGLEHFRQAQSNKLPPATISALLPEGLKEHQSIRSYSHLLASTKAFRDGVTLEKTFLWFSG
jgi:hypothetical protein